MSTSNEQQMNTWWAEGDTPVRNDSRVSYLVDGHYPYDETGARKRPSRRTRW